MITILSSDITDENLEQQDVENLGPGASGEPVPINGG